MKFTTTRRKVFLVVLLFAALAVASSAATGASNRPDTLAGRDTATVMKAIHAGKARQLPTRGSGGRLHGVWNGCRFVFATTQVSEWQFRDGSIAAVNGNPQALPPRDCDGPDRNPTEAEMTAMRATVNAANAGQQPGGAPAPPPIPLPRHLDPDYRPDATPPPTP